MFVGHISRHRPVTSRCLIFDLGYVFKAMLAWFIIIIITLKLDSTLVFLANYTYTYISINYYCKTCKHSTTYTPVKCQSTPASRRRVRSLAERTRSNHCNICIKQRNNITYRILFYVGFSYR